MKISVKNPGALTTVQDLGRYGYQQYGVSVCGACDAWSARLANILVGNDENAAVLECTLIGPVLEFSGSGIIAVTGGDLSPMLDGTPVPMCTAVHVSGGQKLSFGAVKSGLRAYIAFAGGIDVPVVMGSRSTYLKVAMGGLDGRKLAAGDVLNIFPADVSALSLTKRSIGKGFEQRGIYIIHVVMGPQDDRFSASAKNVFLSETYTVTTASDRMGMRLDGPSVISETGYDIISDGINMGAVEIAAGKPIIMLSDRQSTAGYTKIANVITADFRILAQLKGGDRLRFREISMEAAQELYIEETEALRGLRKWLDY